MKMLKRWCAEQGIEPSLQSFPDKKAAVRFLDALPTLAPGLDPVTLNKYPRRLASYWKWLEARDEVAVNVWQGLTLPEPDKPHDELERPFTRDEMIALLTGDAAVEMHDLMRIGALTGCRLDPIVSLKVKDCRDDGVFVFKPQKREKAARLCPIHSDLREIVARRTDGKKPDDPVFPEWPEVPPELSAERSNDASQEFTAYRRRVGVDDVVAGRRRSRVNFHSFRRWFVTEAERAGQPPHLISVAVGHKREGMTLGVYSAGPLIEQVREVVEAVVLPI
jgi:integrase